jgi:hypothetical protein
MIAFRSEILVLITLLLTDGRLSAGLPGTGNGNVFKRFFGGRKPVKPETSLAKVTESFSAKAAQLRETGVHAVEQRRMELEHEVKSLAQEIQLVARQKTTRLKQVALQEAENRVHFIENEIQRLSNVTDSLIQEKSSMAEQLARDKLDQLEHAAVMEVERLAEVAEALTRQKAAEYEEYAMQQLTAFERWIGTTARALIDRLLYGKRMAQYPNRILYEAVAGYVLNALRTMVVCSSLYKFLGPDFVLELWSMDGFGDAFFPFGLSVDKRLLAATLEFGAFALLLLAEDRWRIAGASVAAILFGRASWLHLIRRRTLWLTLYPGTVAALALTFLANELVVPEPAIPRKMRRWYM